VSVAAAAPAPATFLVLIALTGVVDAVSFLALGHVFVANMTGNVVFLGFAAAGAAELSLIASLVAVAAFVAGAFAGARLARRPVPPSPMLRRAILIKIALTAAALGIAMTSPSTDAVRYALIVLLALAMGVQAAVVRRTTASDLSTNVLTTTLAALVADFAVGGGSATAAHRLLAVATMLAGAAAGAALVLHASVAAALVLALALLALDAALLSAFSRA
jgi:uncharacterized membrane protein YoaK (UPF0700 family)